MKDLRKNEKGIALLIALFALLLLSAIGLSMMFSSDAETSINANYRDKQQASYAALSGALEAKDRIQPSNTSSPNYIPFPTDAPNTSNAQVWYIVNPGIGETASSIQPWSASNKYADTEICHEGDPASTFGLTCSTSSSLPSGSWYQSYDNSATSYTGVYKLNNPLQYKWARIQLKTTSSSPYSLSGGTSGQIVCWDGHNQIPKPVGYNKDCTPAAGTVGSVSITDPGTGYNSAPNVSLSGGGGSGAAATAVIGSVSTGTISSITLNNPGSGYSTQPTVTIIGDGTGASAVATIIGGAVTAVTLGSAGNMCYQTAPSVSFAGGGGTGAAATAVLGSNTCIYSISGGTCSSWKNNTYTTSATGGSNDFSASITYKNGTGGIQSVGITNPGTGYTAVPTILSVSGHGTCTPGATITLGKHVASFTLTNGGSGYSSAPTVTIAPGVGTGAVPSATATVGGGGSHAGEIANIAVTNGGSAYTYATVTISGGGGTNATATANLATTNQLTAINITNGGSGYTSAPTVTLNGGGCGSTCGAATAFLANGAIYGQVLQITALAVSRSGSRSMTQLEVATPPRHRLGVTGALTLAGPSVDGEVAYNPPLYNSPNSNPFHISGVDANSCGAAQPSPSLPAIGVYDDPANPTSPTAQAEVTTALARPDHYVGANAAPDVEDIYTDLGDTNSPSNFESFANSVASVATNTYGTNPSSINMGSSTTPTVTVVNGDLTLSGNTQGYGILLVTGTLSMSGNFGWNGVVLVIGKGRLINSGGGNGQINGTIIVARTRDSSGNLMSTLGTPTVDWSGGGGNGIYYDHCWADNQLAKIPFNPGPTTQPLKILSTRTLGY
jgi:Tfp pilus assembly protein PilX